jgi:hypothetical protein
MLLVHLRGVGALDVHREQLVDLLLGQAVALRGHPHHLGEGERHHARVVLAEGPLAHQHLLHPAQALLAALAARHPSVGHVLQPAVDQRPALPGRGQLGGRLVVWMLVVHPGRFFAVELSLLQPDDGLVQGGRFRAQVALVCTEHGFLGRAALRHGRGRLLRAGLGDQLLDPR